MSSSDHGEAVRSMLEMLALRPPQSLLLEGGDEAGRMAAALHWARAANCPDALERRSRDERCVPCGECPVCRQIDALEHLDLLVYDGRISNKQDEENPGPVRAMTVENMRQLKSVNGTAPHGAGRRVAIFQGMTLTREEALNSILKTLEEPSQHTLFVLLTPQRQQILPTLVSRSMCLTLPWRGCLDQRPEVDQWEQALARFLAEGRGFLNAIGAKGAVDAVAASQIVMTCQRSLGRVLAGAGVSALDKALGPLAADAAAAMRLNLWANEAQAMILGNVSPARALEAFGTKVFLLLRHREC